MGLVSSFHHQFAILNEVTVASTIDYRIRYHFQFSICCRTKRTHKSFKSIEFARLVIYYIVIIDQRKISIVKIVWIGDGIVWKFKWNFAKKNQKNRKETYLNYFLWFWIFGNETSTNKCGKRYYFDRIKNGKGMCVEKKLILYSVLTDKLLFKFYSNQLWRCLRSVWKNLSFCDLNIQSQFVWFGSEKLSVLFESPICNNYQPD